MCIYVNTNLCVSVYIHRRPWPDNPDNPNKAPRNHTTVVCIYIWIFSYKYMDKYYSRHGTKKKKKKKKKSADLSSKVLFCFVATD
jgi:hypothetical protein